MKKFSISHLLSTVFRITRSRFALNKSIDPFEFFTRHLNIVFELPRLELNRAILLHFHHPSFHRDKYRRKGEEDEKKKERKKIGKRREQDRTTRIWQRFYPGIDIFFVSLSSIDSGSTRNFPAKLRAPCNSNKGGEKGDMERKKKKKGRGEGDPPPLSGGREWKNSSSAGGDLCRILLDVEFWINHSPWQFKSFGFQEGEGGLQSLVDASFKNPAMTGI